jgi:hypothetical protein
VFPLDCDFQSINSSDQTISYPKKWNIGFRENLMNKVLKKKYDSKKGLIKVNEIYAHLSFLISQLNLNQN